MSSPNPETAESPSHISPMLRLPPEIVKIIVDQGPNSNIKNLRLTCRLYSETVALRLDRVFISANPRNVKVFTAIANHEVFRAKITEIIWDDALLYTRPVPRDAEEAYYGSDDDYDDYAEEKDDACDKNGIDWRGDVPGWFRIACRNNVDFINGECDEYLNRPDLVARDQQACEQMPLEGAWAYYQQLVQQQRDVLNSKAHIIALEKHIGSFPALQRIVITPAAHGWIYNPRYETPMIRAFPRGFNHYIPRSWPLPDNIVPECDEWDEDGGDWQGFRTVTRVLAEGRDFGRVVDLRIDVHELETGLNSRVFANENRTLSDFEAVLARPDFTHLQLDLMVDTYYRQSDVYRSGLLKRALALAACGQGLKYLSLRTSVDTYSRLQHFGLSRFYVEQDDLLVLLASLPKTLQSLELSEIQFMNSKDSYRTLLWAIRDTLGWKERDPRPTLVISTDLQTPNPGRAIWLEHELYSFLYKDGSNPFGNDPAARAPDVIRFGFGWEKDCFNPNHKHPHVDIHDLADLGYIKRGFPRPNGRRPISESPEPGRNWHSIDARYLM